MRPILPALLLAGCTVARVDVGVESCPAGTSPATIAEAYFGRNSGGTEVVTEAEWARFMNEVVTPAFPDGLTVLDGAGQWRGQDGRIGRERTKLLVVALTEGTARGAVQRMAPVITAYRARFGQESVMVTTRAVCVGF